jgi:hypothetical protein
MILLMAHPHHGFKLELFAWQSQSTGYDYSGSPPPENVRCGAIATVYCSKNLLAETVESIVSLCDPSKSATGNSNIIKQQKNH